MFRALITQGKSFLGWLVLLVGTWLIASSAKEYVVQFLPDNSAPTLFIIGLIVIMFAVVIFGKKAPWL